MSYTVWNACKSKSATLSGKVANKPEIPAKTCRSLNLPGLGDSEAWGSFHKHVAHQQLQDHDIRPNRLLSHQFGSKNSTKHVSKIHWINKTFLAFWFFGKPRAWLSSHLWSDFLTSWQSWSGLILIQCWMFMCLYMFCEVYYFTWFLTILMMLIIIIVITLNINEFMMWLKIETSHTTKNSSTQTYWVAKRRRQGPAELAQLLGG